MELHLLITRNLTNIEHEVFQNKLSSMLEAIDFKHYHKTNKLNKKLTSLIQNNLNSNNCTNQSILLYKTKIPLTHHEISVTIGPIQLKFCT